VSGKTVSMATSMDARLAPVTARDGADTRNKDNSGMAAAGTGEVTRLGGGDQERVGQTAARRIRDADSIYEELEGIDREVYEQTLEDLVDVGLLVKDTDDDEDRTYYRASDGMSWSEVVQIDCPIKKQILLTLINNPQTFFVLYNTQKGKLKIAADEIRDWATAEGKKVVAFMIVDNDKTLADQSAEGVISVIKSVADIYLLSSNSGDTMDTIKHRIDSYVLRKNKMPVIVALNNKKQIQKITELMKHVQETMLDGTCPELRYGVVFDEADKVYPPIRDKFKPLLVDDVRVLHRLGFVTATEGDLMDNEYPECANAYMYPVPAGHPDYRAIHTGDAVVRVAIHRVKDSNDAYAETILANNKDYFATRIMLKNGTLGYRKTIVNGGAKTASMETFARNRVADGHYAITVNMLGVWVYRPGHEKKRYATKGKRFGHLLFSIYTELGLHDRPLFIIGRRKVDRGLGFHYAPRDGSDGLVWTDMILGRIDDKDIAVQKAGRLAGVVAQCPQYPGTLTWWTDEKTSRSVSHHNNVVDEANTKRGCSALQAVTRAEVAVPHAPPVDSDPNMGLPVVLDISNAEILAIHAMTSVNKRRRVLQLLAVEHSDLSLDLGSNYECKQVTMPTADGQYSKAVTDVVKLKNEGRKPARFKQEEKKKNIWECVLDNRANRVIVMYRRKDQVASA
jgi:hypothetical protein